jgi:hypothetical protein
MAFWPVLPFIAEPRVEGRNGDVWFHQEALAEHALGTPVNMVLGHRKTTLSNSPGGDSGPGNRVMSTCAYVE